MQIDVHGDGDVWPINKYKGIPSYESTSPMSAVLRLASYRKQQNLKFCTTMYVSKEGNSANLFKNFEF